MFLWCTLRASVSILVSFSRRCHLHSGQTPRAVLPRAVLLGTPSADRPEDCCGFEQDPPCLRFNLFAVGDFLVDRILPPAAVGLSADQSRFHLKDSDTIKSVFSGAALPWTVRAYGANLRRAAPKNHRPFGCGGPANGGRGPFFLVLRLLAGSLLFL